VVNPVCQITSDLYEMRDVNHYSNNTIATKLQARQGCRRGRVAGGAGLQAGQGCRVGRAGRLETPFKTNQIFRGFHPEVGNLSPSRLQK